MRKEKIETLDLFGGDLPELISEKQLAGFLDLSTMRIRQLTDKGLPIQTNGMYHFKDSIKWVIDSWRFKKSKTDADLDNNKRLLIIEQTKKARIDNDIKMKDLIYLEEVKQVISRVAVILSTQLDSIAPRLANELTNQDKSSYIKKVITSETRQIRESIAYEFENFDVYEISSGDNTPAEN